MDFKKTIIRLLVSLILSPVVIYIVLTLARLSGADYEMTHGETWIIWVLMAILINNAMVDKKA
ncbi:MAG: hypothetical protein KJO49_12545 [Bacteroidia bacterium]|nr:hypothetical protein [Bacteroidia bacterium]MBT8268498.1 hypothetical protein [Bacteroidia bacterium]NNF81291.1 hypothetical protein [Flavobacteriaceae bacterium]NNK69742.1 hypothetical protein [Flavobacteriaceae bacterium]NNL80695.1 hypothetical protein [Flavobacteriaceae bacterium]